MNQLPLILDWKKKSTTKKTEADPSAPISEVAGLSYNWLINQEEYNRIEVKWNKHYLVIAKLKDEM